MMMMMISSYGFVLSGGFELWSRPENKSCKVTNGIRNQPRRIASLMRWSITYAADCYSYNVSPEILSG